MASIFFSGAANAQFILTDYFIENAMYDSAFVNKLVEVSWNNYATNKTYALRTSIAEKDVSRAKWSWFNSLSFQYQYFPFGTNTGSTDASQRIGFGLSINIGNLISVPIEISQKKDLQKIAEYSADAQKNYIRKEVKIRLAPYIEGLKIYRSRTQTLDDAKALFAQIKMQYQRGDVDFEKYNGSIRWISDMEETKAKAETAVYLAKANLEEILGMNLEDVK